MSRIQDVTHGMEQIGNEIDVALRLENGLEKYECLAELHRSEAECWKQYFESRRDRMGWLAACAAADRSRCLARFWDGQATRETELLQNQGALLPSEMIARAA